ncbi:MAG: DUF3426 domain-containing protein [Parvibaculum sp.]
MTRMIITCPSCSARYPVDASSFAPSGRKVRCAKCGNTWHQAPPSDLGGEEDGLNNKSAAKSSEASGEAVAAKPLRESPAGQKPLFNTATPAKPKTSLPVAEEESSKPAGGVDGDDGKAVDKDGYEAGATASEPPVKFYDVSAAQAATGGKLRSYLNDVASMRRGRVVGMIGWASLVLFVVGSIYGVVQYRREIATLWPASAKLYEAAGAPINLVGFELAQVSYERQDENGLPVLAIKGMVVNVSDETKAVPRVRVGLLDENQKELYHWTFALAEAELKPKEKASFVTRLSSPPIGARDLEVRFVEPGEEPAVKDGSSETSSPSGNGATMPQATGEAPAPASEDLHH